jgi:TonB family protein
VSDPDESAPFGSERSTLVSMGSRRFWFFRAPAKPDLQTPAASANGDSPQIFHSMLGDLASRAGNAADARAGEGTDESPPSTNGDPRQIFHSMLGDLASRSGNAAVAEAALAADAEAGPPRSMLSLDGAAEQAAAIARAGAERAAAARPAVAPQPAAAARSGAATPFDAIARAVATVRVAGVTRSAGPRSQESAEPPAPLTQHSTLAELAGIEEHVSRAFPIERAILISLVAHVVLVVLMLVAPGRSAAPQGNLIDLLAAAMETPRDDTPIPAYFTEAPGAPRENPNRAPLSDADRRAGGGDPAKPKADLPYVPRSRGIEGLAPGPRAPRIAGGAPAAPKSAAERAAEAAASQNRAALEKADPSAEPKPSEFPADMRPQLGGEPREVTKLAGLDAAIRDAARGTIRGQAGGGEDGAPVSNEDGGFVDVGGVSFETNWYDWGPYAAEMLRRIKLHWKISRDLIILQQRGTVQVAFSIMTDGTVADVRVLRPSTIPPYTHAAMKAIIESNPFRPLPKDLMRLVPGKDRERIVIHFIYFPTPEELDGRGDGSDPRP